jgi:hypothetical protein
VKEFLKIIITKLSVVDVEQAAAIVVAAELCAIIHAHIPLLA